MKRSKFSEEQIVYTLCQPESGTLIDYPCRQYGIAEQAFYAWKKKYAHLSMSELRRPRQLEEENSRLKRRVADLSLDKYMLSEALRKQPEARPAPELAQWFHGTFQVSCARACRLAQFGRASWYRKSRAKDQTAMQFDVLPKNWTHESWKNQLACSPPTREGQHEEEQVFRRADRDGLAPN